MIKHDGIFLKKLMARHKWICKFYNKIFGLLFTKQNTCQTLSQKGTVQKAFLCSVNAHLNLVTSQPFAVQKASVT